MATSICYLQAFPFGLNDKLTVNCRHRLRKTPSFVAKVPSFAVLGVNALPASSSMTTMALHMTSTRTALYMTNTQTALVFIPMVLPKVVLTVNSQPLVELTVIPVAGFCL